MSRAFLLIVLVALTGGLGLSFWLGTDEQPITEQGISFGNLSGGQRIAPASMPTAPLATAESAPCASCDQNQQRWREQTSVSPPVLLGQTAAVIDSCGSMLFGQMAFDRRPAASLVKVATALVAVEQGRWREEVDIQIMGWDLSAENGSTIMGLEPGMRMTVEELVWGLMLRSGNDAAIEIARAHGGEQRFVSLMNTLAADLGLRDTRFRNPHGLDAEGAYSSAFDMTILGKALLANPTLANMVATKDHITTWDSQPMPNSNWLLYIYPEAIGIKTGFTETAGGTIVAAASRNGRTLIASVFNSDDVFWDSMRLFDWAFENTRSVC